MTLTRRTAIVALVLVHVPLLIIPVAFAWFGLAGVGAADTDPAARVRVVVLGVLLAAVQLWHSLHAAAGRRPPRGFVSLLALAALVFVPMWAWFGMLWVASQALLAGSVLMVLRGRARVAVFVAAVAVAGWITAYYATQLGVPIGLTASWVLEGLVFDAGYGFALWAAARLVHLLDEQAAARAELAEVAVARERLRVSRDLHDLIGQSLAAASLKAGVARQALSARPADAAREAESIASLAAQAQDAVRTMVRSGHVLSLQAELDSASSLLTAAGVVVDARIAFAGLDPRAESVLAWAVREGVTNMLRHGEPRRCTLMGERRDGRVALTLLNDGVAPRRGDGTGTGLAGLAARAREAGGRIAAGQEDGWFRLTVELPEEMAR